MPLVSKFVAVNSSVGAAVAIGTDTGFRDITFTATAAVYLVFGYDDATTAATAMGTSAFMVFAGNVVPLTSVQASRTWVRAQAAAATAASYVYYLPSV